MFLIVICTFVAFVLMRYTYYGILFLCLGGNPLVNHTIKRIKMWIKNEWEEY